MLCSIYWSRPRSWLVSITILLILLLTALFSTEKLYSEEANHFIAEFTKFERSFEHEKKTGLQAHQFLYNFLEKIKLEYGISLTLAEAGRLVETHLDEFALPKAIKTQLLELINFIYKMDDSTKMPPSLKIHLSPWNTENFTVFFDCSFLDWLKNANSFDISTKDKILLNIDHDPPDGVIIGLVEIFAGALLCIIPTEVTWAIGGGLILDGVVRAVGATAEIAEENKLSKKPQT